MYRRVLILIVFCHLAASINRANAANETTNSPVIPGQPSGTEHLKAVDEDRLRFARERQAVPSHGLYADFRAQSDAGTLWFPNYGPDGGPIAGSGIRFPGVITNTGSQTVLPPDVAVNPDEIPASDLTSHILAQELTEPQVREAVQAGHVYIANDRLCDPTGFVFGIKNNLGIFGMGDTAPMIKKTTIVALLPLAANLRLIHNGTVVLETNGANITFDAKTTGSFRLEARLLVGGEDRPWIYSYPVYLRSPSLLELVSLLPSPGDPSVVKMTANIEYVKGDEADEAKHKLDVYQPKSGSNAPVLFFIHGGSWKSGDRSQYPPLGNRFVREGFVTVVPSYRLAPKNRHPAQVDDVAAAFAWTVRHIAEYGGDTNRIYVGGHSAGGHLAALLCLDESYLARHGLSQKNIRGVLAFSGVYDLSVGENLDSVFGKNETLRRNASPLFHIKSNAPPFLVTYCQWDYFSLPAQARTFYQALKRSGIPAELVYVPEQSHISEIISITGKDDPMAVATLRFMNKP